MSRGSQSLLVLSLLVAACNQGPRGYGPRPPTASKPSTPTPTPTGPAAKPGPVPSAITGPILELAAGGDHACVRRQGGGVQCWGRGGSGELGDGNLRDSPKPVPVLDLADAEELALGAQHSCARQRGGMVVCWGSNGDGQLGDGTGRPGAASA